MSTMFDAQIFFQIFQGFQMTHFDVNKLIYD